LAAHMDQIGLMVTDIDDKGFLRFTNIGGISHVLSLGQKVIFKNGTVGVIFAESVDNIGKLKLENMFIDIGVLNNEEAEKIVSIGDICVYESGFSENYNVIFSKCLDDRIGCFVLIETLKRVKNSANDL